VIRQVDISIHNAETWSSIVWMYREEDTGSTFTYFDIPGVFHLTGQDSARTLTLTVFDAAGSDHLQLPVSFGKKPTLPIGEWSLLVFSVDQQTKTLSAFTQSESSPRTYFETSGTTWAGGYPEGDFTIGSTSELPTAPGLINLFTFSGHVLSNQDVDDIWQEGSPMIFSPLTTSNVGSGGNLTGSFRGVNNADTGCNFILSVGPNTAPGRDVAKAAQPTNPGSPIGTRALVSFSSRLALASEYIVESLMVQAHPELLFVSPNPNPCRVVNIHDVNAPWGGFFDIQSANSLGGRQPYVAHIAPRTRSLVQGEMTATTFVLIGANSRATRGFCYPSSDDVENYVGGALRHFESSVVGVWNIPLGLNNNRYRFLRDDPSDDFFASGDVKRITKSLDADQEFARWWTGSSGGETSGAGAGFLLSSDGATVCVKARPELGTGFSSAAQPMRFQAFLLQFPGGGDVQWDGRVGDSIETLGDAVEGVSGSLSTDSLDTIEHAMRGGDVYTSTPELRLDGDMTNIIGTRNCVYVSQGDAKGWIGTITSISFDGAQTVLSVQHEAPVVPSVTGGAVLKFGTAGVVKLESDFEGIPSGGPFRGVAFTSPDGAAHPVAILSAGAWATDVAGVVLGPVGRAANGWSGQLSHNSSVAFQNMFASLNPDVFLQFYAQQGSQPESMRDFGEVFRAACPDAEHWWIGDPQHTSGPYLDWDQYILNEAPVFGIGAATAVDDPQVGNIWEQCAQGFRSTGVHHSDDGAQKYIERVCEVLKVAALPNSGDFNGDNVIDNEDRLILCNAIGVAGDEPEYDVLLDMNSDGDLSYLDLAAFDLAYPKPCPADLVSSITFAPPPDGVVDGADLAYVLSGWVHQYACADVVTNTTFAPPADGMVDGAELAVLLSTWGECE